MKGVLLFAFNNERVDYLKMAKLAARRVHKHWKLPVCLVTDAPPPKRMPTEIVFWRQVERPEVLNTKSYLEYGLALSYWNANRHDAFELTPFQQTILLDTDYMVNGTDVIDAWDGSGVKLTNRAHSVDGTEFTADMKWFSFKHKMPMYWATIVCFDKSPMAREFFTEWSKVVQMYSIYAGMFGFEPSPLRNDFAVSVALQKLKGSVQNDFFDLPYSIPTLMPGSTLASLDPMIAFVRSEHPDEFDIVGIQSDLHVLNKKSILECKG